MPLVTEILRGGEALQIKWSYAHLSCMYTVALKEGDPGFECREGKTFGDLKDGEWVSFEWVPIYYLKSKAPLVTKGSQKLMNDYSFDIGEDTPFVLKAGDVLRAWREYKQ